MSEQQYNTNDVGFLLSRSLDEVLSTADRARLERALAASPELRTEAAGYRALHRLLARWAAETAGTAAESMHSAVEGALQQSRVETGRQTAAEPEKMSEDEFSGLDRLLSNYARDEARVDWAAFTDSVMRQIDPARAAAVAPARAGGTRRMMLRLAVPLAAAAALAFAILAGPWRKVGDGPDIVLTPVHEPASGVDTPLLDNDNLAIVRHETRTAVVADVSYERYETVARVSFVREPSPDWVAAAPRRAVGYATVSFAAPARNSDAGPF